MRRDRAQAMVIQDNKILMVKHRLFGREFYCLPGGGVEGNETYEQAALRELQEESLVKGSIVRKLSIQFKPDGKGEVHTFLVKLLEGEVPGVGKDPEFSEDEQSIIGVEWLEFDEIGEADKAYLWASGLNRIEYFHDKLLKLENTIYKQAIVRNVSNKCLYTNKKRKGCKL